MGSVNLRIFQCASGYDRERRLVVNDVYVKHEYEMPVRLADLVRVNAMALPLRAPASYQVLRHELRLLLSYLPDKRYEPLGLRLRDFRASASHIRRFITESVGRGMLTAAVHEEYRWSYRRRGLDDFDVLPTRLAGRYKSSGVRPDLLFSFRNDGEAWRLAGEARGRSTSRPKGSAPSAKQLQRLNELLGWSARHDHHPLTMTWAYTGSAQVNVDLFVVEQPDSVPPRSSSSAEQDAHVAFRFAEDLPPEAILGRAAKNAVSVVESLYRSGPTFGEARGPWDQEMRGNWVTADLLGPSTTHLLLGVLDRAPSGDVLARRRSQPRGRQEDWELDPVQVEVFGRLLVVIAQDRDRPPPWSEVSARLE